MRHLPHAFFAPPPLLFRSCCVGGTRDEDASVPREPLEVQLENLGLWHASLVTELRKFKVGGGRGVRDHW